MLTNDKSLVIAGGGLVGSLLGLRLLQRGFDVAIYEMRPDMRKTDISAGKSINLALSDRGIQSLKLCGIDREIMRQAIQMKGRLIHPLEGELQFQAYSARPGDCINSISRKALNIILLDAIEKIRPHAIHFDCKLVDANPEQYSATFRSKEHGIIELNNIRLLCTDGAFSQGRRILFDHSSHIRFNYQQKFQNYGYKELTIPPDGNRGFRLEKNALHIWPRGHFLMIGLPNPDATFTATLFLPFEGPDSFAQIQDNSALGAFFEKYFPDAVDHLTGLYDEFFEHPTGQLITVKCDPWHYGDSLLLMGDAAHAIIPFYGQGMNCGFEDIFAFDKLLDTERDWQTLFAVFYKLRKPNADAIADLAEDNFIEMRDKVADPIFQRKRKLELLLEEKYPDYFSKYALVTFRPDVSYYDAMIKGRKQDELLLQVCAEIENVNTIDLEKLFLQLNIN